MAMRRRVSSNQVDTITTVNTVTLPAEVSVPDKPPSEDQSPSPPPGEVGKPVDREAIKAAVGNMQMGAGVGRIIETIFAVGDVNEEYLEIREWIRKKRVTSLSSGEIRGLLDEAEDYSQRAAELFAIVKQQHADYEIDANAIRGAMRDAATDELKRQKKLEKASGDSSKAITNADVDATMALMFGDEWKDLTARTSRAKHSIGVFESLHHSCTERSRALRQMTSPVRDER